MANIGEKSHNSQIIMREKSLLKDRIMQYLDFKGITKYEFYQKTGISNGVLSQKSGLSEENLMRFLSQYNEVDVAWLLSGKGNMIKNAAASEILVREPTGMYRSPAVVTVDSHNRDNIVLVPQAVQAGYLAGGFAEPRFIQKLPTYRMPGLDNGIFRLFEVKGNSMFPTVPARSYVAGQFVEDWGRDIKDNQIYVVVSQDVDDGLVKRCINRIDKYNNLICKSDNRREYSTQNIDPSSIREIWEVKLHLNFNLPDPSDIYDRVNDLEAEMQQIKARLN